MQVQAGAIFNPTYTADGAGQLNIIPPQAGQEEAALYVGNLSPDATKAILHQHFMIYGNVTSIAIKTNYYTGESRGFAFVNFANMEDAKKAKDALNHTNILGREIRICFKKDFKNLDPEANVYLKDLPATMRGKQVEEEFAPYGTIFSCIVKYGDDGKHLGYGYVQFKEKESAEKAIQALNGIEVSGTKITVQHFKPRSKRDIPSWKTNLYVKGFPQSWNKQKVEEFINKNFKVFAEGGETSSICVKENEKLGRCFAFVAYKTEEDALKAMKALNEHQVDNETLFVGYSQKKTQRRRQLAESFAKQANETNLFIKSLKEDVTEEQLKKIFSTWGEVTSVAVQMSSKVPRSIESHGVKLKFGFINFKEENAAKQAFIEAKRSPEVKALISEFHDDKKDFLHFAQPKNVREQYLKMVRKNLQATTMLQSQMNMFKMMMQMGNKNRMGQSKQGQRGGRGPQPGNLPGINPMMNMFNQQPMDMSSLSSMLNMGSQFMMMPNMNMGGFAAPQYQMGQFGQMPSMPAVPQPTAAPEKVAPVLPQAAPADTKDLDWLIKNQKQFEQMDPNEKRKMLGNLMYYRVATLSVDKDLVPKITGMLIDLEVLELSDIIDILTKDEALNDKVADAINIINENDQ